MDEEIHLNFRISELLQDPIMLELVKTELRSGKFGYQAEEILIAIEVEEAKQRLKDV